MLRVACALCVACLLLCFAPHAAFAQSLEERVRNQADRIEREETERSQESLSWLREQDHRPFVASPPGPVPATPPGGGEACVQVEEVAVDGVRVVEPQLVALAVSRFEGLCLGLADLNQILETVTFLYVDAGYVASRAYLPPQDLSDGSLAVVVVEGTLETIVMDGEPDRHRAQIQSAFPGMADRPVNLRDIEQGLEQLNRLRSMDAHMELQAGAQPGGSVLQVFAKRSRPVHVSLDMDNLGGSSTGRYQSRLNLGFDSALGINDEWRFSFQRSMEGSPWKFSSDRPNSNTVTAALSVPRGYWTFALNANWTSYRSEVDGTQALIRTSGVSRMFQVDVRRVLHRDQNSKTVLSSWLRWKDTQTHILGNFIEASSRTLTTAGVELTHSKRLLNGWVTTSLGHQWGLDVLGAFDDDGAPADSPKGQFLKWVFRLGINGPLEFGRVQAAYDWSLSAQWSPDHLFGSEQMSVGGYSSVRGVREAPLFGNRAAVMRSELSLLSIQGGSFPGAVKPHFGFDCGAVSAQPAFGIDGGSLCGVAVGLRGRVGGLDLDLHYSDAITSSGSGVFQLRLSHMI